MEAHQDVGVCLIRLKHPCIGDHMKSSKWRVGHAARDSLLSVSCLSRTVATGVGALALICAGVASATVLDIKTLSTRPDRVSGGDVLVQITQDDNAATPVTLNGTNVTSVFRAVWT